MLDDDEHDEHDEHEPVKAQVPLLLLRLRMSVERCYWG
jgi:hypothetical protein